MRLHISVILAACLVVAAGTAAIAQRPVYKPGDGVTLPQLVKEVRAQYTSAALAERLQGTVTLDAIVEADGKVSEVTVTESFDKEYGLDDQAVAAARQWEFKPGTREGKPVAVQITVQISFRLK